jgi:hypothetical protein
VTVEELDALPVDTVILGIPKDTSFLRPRAFQKDDWKREWISGFYNDGVPPQDLLRWFPTITVLWTPEAPK